ncbi:MAG: hypothetical protein IMF18_12835 [Proteobacteria bacterium]|nr:hypothetical protein [Pseudomonadota bacterium]
MRWPLLIMFLFFAGGAMSAVASEAEVSDSEDQKNAGPPIHITSDRVESDQKMRCVEFIGGVKATQADVVVTADRIKIFYKPGGDTAGKSTAVERMIARGNVKIVFDKKTKTAIAEKADYTADTKVLVLSGGDPTVWSGKNIIKGEKITLFQAEDRTLVEGSEREQVEATFYSEGEGGLIK